MCRRVECPRCGRPSFAGCGAHVEQVLHDVPSAERCACREQGKAAAEPMPERSWLRSVLGLR